MAIIERNARCEQDLMLAAIDRHDAAGDQFDVLVAVKFVRPKHQALGTARPFKIGLRERWPLIRQMRLIVEHPDRLGEAMLAQRGRELKTRMASADNHNRSAQNKSFR